MKSKELKVGDVVESWGLFDDSDIKWWERIYYPMIRRFDDTIYWFKKQYQRCKTGFPHEESWGFYSYCAQWSLPRLKNLRANLHGHPAFIFEETDSMEYSNQRCFSFIKDVPVRKTPLQKWEETLDKIIWAMENHDNPPDPIYPPNFNHNQVVSDVRDNGISFKNLDERPVDFSPIYRHEERVQEGFELFGKHFRNLWD